LRVEPGVAVVKIFAFCRDWNRFADVTNVPAGRRLTGR